MFYVVQENTFREENYDNLIRSLNRLELEYDVVKILPFVDAIVKSDYDMSIPYTDELEYKIDRKDVFVFGSLKLARLSKKYGWNPGSLIGENHDYRVYSKYYKDNLLNYDSRIYKFGEDFDWEYGSLFVRPCEDTKVFTGQVFDDIEDWRKFRNQQLNNGHSTVLTKDTEIQVCSVKDIQKEFRFWIIDGQIVTYSQYRLGSWVVSNEMVDDESIIFCEDMIKLFKLARAFTMDICSTNDGYKIVECGSVACAGFYKSDIQKLLMTIDDSF